MAGSDQQCPHLQQFFMLPALPPKRGLRSAHTLVNMYGLVSFRQIGGTCGKWSVSDLFNV